MKLFVVLALIAVAVAFPQQRSPRQSPDDQVQVVRYVSDNIGLGQYNYVYELSNGQKHEEQAELRNAGAENEAIAVRGSYSWVGPDGVTYTVNYIADENGYQPTIEQGPGGSPPRAVIAALLG